MGDAGLHFKHLQCLLLLWTQGCDFDITTAKLWTNYNSAGQLTNQSRLGFFREGGPK